MPSRSLALPAASNSMGRFLKHMSVVFPPGPLAVARGLEAVAAHLVGRLAVGLPSPVAALGGVLVLGVELVDGLLHAPGGRLGPPEARRPVLLPAGGEVLVHPGQVAYLTDE